MSTYSVKNYSEQIFVYQWDVSKQVIENKDDVWSRINEYVQNVKGTIINIETRPDYTSPYLGSIPGGYRVFICTESITQNKD